MAEKHKAPDERQFDPDAAGEQRDGLRGSQEAYPESNTNIWVRDVTRKTNFLQRSDVKKPVFV